MKFAASIDSSCPNFLVAGDAVCQHLTAIGLLSVAAFEIGSRSSKTLPLLYQVCVIVQILSCHFNNVHSIFSRCSFRLRETLSLLLLQKRLLVRSSLTASLPWCSPFFRLHSNFRFSCSSHHSDSDFVPEALSPSESPMRVGIHFFQTPVKVGALPMNYQCSFIFLSSLHRCRT